MNKRPVDVTNPKNICCGHCRHWRRDYVYVANGEKFFKRVCSNPKSKRLGTAYWNRCKCFEWCQEIIKEEGAKR